MMKTLLVAIMMLSMAVVAVSAADTATFDIAVESDSTADVAETLNPGDIVEIKVVIENNPGASQVEIDLEYDPAVLVPVDANEDGKVDIENGDTYTFGTPIVANKGDKKVLLVMSNAEATDVTKTGAAFTVAFQIAEDFEEGTAAVAISAIAMKTTFAGVDTNTDAEPIIYGSTVSTCHFDYENPITEEADCLNDGRIYVKCTDEGCEEIEVLEVLPALGHDLVVIEATAPTCTETGLTAGEKCEVCGEITVAQEEVPATGHTPEFVAATAPTCTEAGLTAGMKCAVCGEFTVEQKEIAALGHTFGEYVANDDATCTANATETAKCVRCDVTDTRTVAGTMKDHNVKDSEATEPTCTTPGFTSGGVCADCGAVVTAVDYIAPLGHTAGEVVVENKVDATCTDKGSYDNVVYCTVCKEEISRETVIVDKLAHTEKVVAGTAATCTAAGLTDGKICEVCETILVAQEIIPVAAHTEETIAAVAPTCTTAGSTEGKKCSVCGVVTVAPATVDPAAHTEETIAAVAPTCTTAGSTEGKKCSVCGVVTVAPATVDPAAHTEETIAAVAPTCTTAGSTEGKKCSVCGVVTVAPKVVDPTGHTEEVIPAVEATKKADGLTEGKKCTTCGEITDAQGVIPMLPTSLAWLWVLIAAIVVIGALVVVYFVVLRKKK